MVRRAVLTAFALFSLLLVGASSAFAQAGTYTEVDRAPITVTFPNPCTGEDVTVSGYFQVVFHITEDANGGIHVAVEGNASQVSGVGTSGTKYRATGGFWEEFNVPAGGAIDYTLVDVINLISQGSGDNFAFHVTLHFTVDANGNPTAEVVNISAECRG